MNKLSLFIVFASILNTTCYGQINQLTGWDGGNLSVLNDDLREIISKSGIQQINPINDLSTANSLSVLNDNIALVGRQLSVEGVSALTGFDDTNLSVLNDDLSLIGQNV